MLGTINYIESHCGKFVTYWNPAHGSYFSGVRVPADRFFRLKETLANAGFEVSAIPAGFGQEEAA
jgi:hypothetical protein